MLPDVDLIYPPFLSHDPIFAACCSFLIISHVFHLFLLFLPHFHGNFRCMPWLLPQQRPLRPWQAFRARLQVPPRLPFGDGLVTDPRRAEIRDLMQAGAAGIIS